MKALLRLFIACREAHYRLHRGQTMTEYALVLAAVAVAVFAAYASTGNSIGIMVSWSTIDRDLLGS